MARRKKTEQAETKGFEQSGPLDPSYGAFTIPSYPYGGKQPKTTDSPAFPPTVPPTIQSKPSNEAEGMEAKRSTSSEPVAATDDTPEQTRESTPDTSERSQGDTLPIVPASVASDVGPTPSLTRDRSPAYTVKIRLEREGRWPSIEPIRDDMMRAARKQGMDKAAAQAWTYSELDRLYPPIPKAEPPPVPEEKPLPAPEMPTSATPGDELPGLYSLPANWPPLPDNASLPVELGWVQSQRLAVVEERGNSTVVRLERASSPAPSKAALGWLETSIRSYAKYIEVAAKSLAGQQDEAESVRRERMRLDEIRALLDEMHKDAV